MMPMRLALAGLLCSILLLQGCAHRKVNDLAIALPSSGPERILTQLEQLSLPDRDRAQYLLDAGILKLYIGNMEAARADLQQAKAIMSALQAVSISENLAAATSNEAMRSYSGTPSDRVLVHFYLALSYLLSGDLDGARVEVLQSDVTMQSLSDDGSLAGQLASMRFLTGLVYEINGEYDDALIAYRRAYSIMIERGDFVPEALQISLLNMTRQQGFIDEYEGYRAEFGREDALPGPGEAEWVLLHLDGVVSTKTEIRFPVFDAGLDDMVTVVMPKYEPSYYRPRFSLIESGVYRQRTSVLEDMEQRARDDLDAEYPAILAAATVRAIAKLTAVNAAQNANDIAGLLAVIAAFATEQADLRSWNMLPASVQVARIRAPFEVPVLIPESAFAESRVTKSGGEPLSLMVSSSLSKRVFSYPPIVYSEPVPDKAVEANGDAIEAGQINAQNGDADSSNQIDIDELAEDNAKNETE